MGDMPWFVAVPLAVVLVLFCIGFIFVLLSLVCQAFICLVRGLEEVRKVGSGEEGDDHG